MATVKVGDTVKVAAGAPGAGYRFTVVEIGEGWSGTAGKVPVVYGPGYGPVRMSEVEVVS